MKLILSNGPGGGPQWQAEVTDLRYCTAPLTPACARHLTDYRPRKTLAGALSTLSLHPMAGYRPEYVEGIVKRPGTGRYHIFYHVHKPERCGVQPAVYPEDAEGGVPV